MQQLPSLIRGCNHPKEYIQVNYNKGQETCTRCGLVLEKLLFENPHTAYMDIIRELGMGYGFFCEEPVVSQAIDMTLDRLPLEILVMISNRLKSRRDIAHMNMISKAFRYSGRDSMFCLAGGRGDAEMVKLMLDRGAAIEAKDEDGWTAIMLAAYNGHTEIVKMLLDRGAAVEARDADGNTALMWAAMEGHTATVGLLLDWGAAVECKDGYTALMAAARNGQTETVKLLLERGVDVKAKMGTGLETMTALVWAARNGIAEIVELLLDWGAAVEANDDDGIDALFLAAERSTRYGDKISNLLQCRGVLGR